METSPPIPLLLLPYVANLLILIPVGPGALFNLFPVAGNHFPESPGWRTLTGSLWTAILLGSILGLFHPLTYSPLLLLQVLYKSFWLLVYALPRLIDPAQRTQVHPGIAATFLAIVLTYPWVIPWSHLFP